MNATARNQNETDSNLNETVVYESDPLSRNRDRDGRQRPEPGSPAMPSPANAPHHQPGQSRYTFSSGARPLDGYTVKRAIGRGGFGEVYYATSDSGKEVALKLILRNLEVERRGVSQCMNLKCPNLVTIYDLRANDAGETFVIMEYVSGPSLANVLAQHPNGLPPAEAMGWLKGLVEGVTYLHDHGIVHRDLKPANLFMEDGVVKIGDYGLAKLIAPSQGGSAHSESIGTCHYMAPEIASGKYHKPIDIYAMGVILFEMLTGKVPFEGESVGEVLMKHLTARPDVSSVPEPFRGIVARALAKDPNHRPGRVADLLPPDLAPKSPNVRFIGEGKAAPTTPEQGSANGKPRDDMHFIAAEESVFYIGPDTRPPREDVAARLRANWNAARARRIAKAVQRRQQHQTRPVPQPQRPQPAARPAFVAPPEPPALPSARVRTAELASSMLWAAPVLALLTVPAVFAFQFSPSANPDRIALLYGMALLGTWGALISGKLAEGRTPGRFPARTTNLAMGAAVGLLGAVLASWVEVGQMENWGVTLSQVEPQLTRYLGPLGRPAPAVFAAYFAALGFVTRTSLLTARDRRRRFRIFPILKTGVLASAIALLVPFPAPWGLAVGLLTVAGTQIVSPWSAPAAHYARYAAKYAKWKRKQVA